MTIATKNRPVRGDTKSMGTRKRFRPVVRGKRKIARKGTKSATTNLPPLMTTAQARRKMGGKFPDISGRQHAYPPSSNEKAWTALVNRAVRMRFKDKLALASNKSPPSCKARPQYEYILFHCSPYSKRKRAIRNAHRKLKGLKVGDPRVVHHENQRTMNFSSAVVLTKCQHKRAHGATCTRKSTVRK